MKVINKIVISKFRSFGENVQIDCADINVFSGGNDSGKSNIIKALNLFFNGKTDNYAKLVPKTISTNGSETIMNEAQET